jgi:hypothetical protein
VSPSSQRASANAFAKAVGGRVKLEFSARKGGRTMAPLHIADKGTVDAAWSMDLLRFFQAGGLLPPAEFAKLLDLAASALEGDPTVAALGDPGKDGRWAVVGDLHGSLADLR